MTYSRLPVNIYRQGIILRWCQPLGFASLSVPNRSEQSYICQWTPSAAIRLPHVAFLLSLEVETPCTQADHCNCHFFFLYLATLNNPTGNAANLARQKAVVSGNQPFEGFDIRGDKAKTSRPFASLSGHLLLYTSNPSRREPDK